MFYMSFLSKSFDFESLKINYINILLMKKNQRGCPLLEANNHTLLINKEYTQICTYKEGRKRRR